jgi:hypothetical protein
MRNAMRKSALIFAALVAGMALAHEHATETFRTPEK